MDDGNARNHIMMMQGNNPSMLGMVPMLQGMAVANPSTDMHHLPTHPKTENDSLGDNRMSTYNRRSKVRSSSKSDNVKGDEKVILLHTRVQDLFAASLVRLVSDEEAQNLQCCVTYGKPCGCIRKFILAGPQWKESSKPNLRVGSMKDKELDSIVNSDIASLGEVEVTRAKELLDILRHAAELKKEKCYVTTENVDGKPVKELRGMIGLGNGRKRSKKYEDFVLDKRAKLREEYSLCEKAAQKLLGYSINFLYKKLRTNPQRTSRLVATNKAERAAKGPRNLIQLEQLREMANNQQSAEKGKKAKPHSEDQNKNLLLKTEKREPFTTGGQGMERFPVSYDARGHSDPSNLNNSNNRYDSEVQFVPETISPPPPNRTLPAGVGTMFSAELSRARHLSRENMPAYQQFQRPSQQGHGSSQPMYMPPDNGAMVPTVSEMGTAYSTSNFNPSLHAPGTFQENAESSYDRSNQVHYKGTMTISDGHGGAATSHPANTSAQTIVQERPAHESEAAQYHVAHPPHLVGADQSKFHPTSFIAGFADSGANFDPGQGYYFAANSGNSQEGFIPAGPIPFFFTQAQPLDSSNPDQEGNAPSQFILLSPALPNNPDKSGGDFENLKPMMMPLTPIQMYPASYFHGGMQGDNKGADAQHFVFSASDPNAAYHGQQPQDQDVNNYPQQASAADGTKRLFVQGGQEQAYFPPLTPLAVMQPQNSNFFSGWLATHPPVSMPVQSSEQKKTDAPDQYGNQQKYYNEEVPPGQVPYLKTEKTQLPAMSQWASSNHNQAFAGNAQQPANQWIGQANSLQEQKKPFVQQPTSQPPMLLQPNPTINVSTSETKVSLRNQMPPLAPLQNATSTEEEKAPTVQAFSSSLQNVDASAENSLPKPSAISERSKRFSRDRLVANIDSPGIILPPMTPLTPALTPLIAGVAAAGLRTTASSVKAENQSVSTSSDQPSEDNVFRFPPTYISHHVAALRVQGLTSPEDPKQDLATAADSKMEESHDGRENAGNVSRDTGATQNSVSGDTAIMVSLSNVKPVPVLSLPVTCFPDDTDSKTKTSEAHSDQQLQTPTAVLNTPTHQLTPSHLSTPTHQLHTPNQTINTPTQPLNTPTQSLNTPTQVVSPSNDDQSPIKRLMPVPASKKRKADYDTEDKSPKQSRSEIATESLLDVTQVRTTVASKPFGSNSRVDSREKASEKSVSSGSVETIEIVDNDDDHNSSHRSEPDASDKSAKTCENSSALLKSEIFKQVPPTFSLPSGTDNPPQTPSSQTQLNTPVFVPSNVVFGKMNPGLLRRGSGSDKGVTSTPQFFTFMPPNAGLPSPMFFAPLHTKAKTSDNATDDSNEKPKVSPLKRGGMTLNLSSKSLSEDGLQTPSKIPVVTPSAIIGTGLAEVPQMFSFQDVPPHIRVSSTPEKSKHIGSSAENAKYLPEKEESICNDDSKRSKSKMFRLPSLVVDPPSDSEGKNDTQSSSKTSAIQIQSKSEKIDKPSPAKTPPTAAKPSLHRTRSGSKKDLVLSLNDVNSADAESFTEPATSSPLNTPSGIQVITPTLPGSKMTSPIHRGHPKIRGRPQPIMMTPICLSGNTTSQVATPTFFHIISPNQLPPSSPSVLMYPYPTRGSGPLSTGSIASPAFGFFPKGATQASGSNSASLLKSALMRKLPVFQFPPPVPTSTTAAESTAPDKDRDNVSKEQSKPGDRELRRSVSETCDSSTSPPATSASARNDSEKSRN